ncbi:MAG TPA: hypothetical protein PLA90_17905, partial [Candidatus Sumerlaeota bacterium]|nr:hypothetical protein [Candidatus Sumerlaeota bacterium]
SHVEIFQIPLAMNLKTAVKDRKRVICSCAMARKRFGLPHLLGEGFDYANREIGGPGNRFLPLKMGISGRAGVSPA